MKIVNIIGGLGNQMFQYAFGKELEFRTKENVYYNTDWFAQYALHNGFELERLFAIDFSNNLAEKKTVQKLATAPYGFFNRLRRKYATKKTHYIDRFFSYNEAVFNLTDNVFYDGFWQSDMYFNHVTPQILQDFTFKLPLSQKNQELLNSYKNSVTASIHVRRGDYLKSENLNVCTKQYFINAIDRLNFLCGQKQIEHFFIFSDDIDWCIQNINTANIPKTFVNWNKSTESWQDMAIMSQCTHNIIANSSFSWWAAFLNKNPTKTVIAPKIWNMRELVNKDHYYNYDFSTVVPKTWERVEI